MGLKYADLEIRWSGISIDKDGAVSAELKTELGYYDPSGKWNKVRDHGTYVVDYPALAVLMGLPPAGKSLAEALDAVIYGFIAQQPPYYAIVSVPLPGGTKGLYTLEIPGRGTLSDVAEGAIDLRVPPAPKATLRINLSGYQEAVWTGPLVGQVSPAIEFVPKQE